MSTEGEERGRNCEELSHMMQNVEWVGPKDLWPLSFAGVPPTFFVDAIQSKSATGV